MSNRKLSVTSLRNIRDLSKGETIDFLRKHINPKLRCIEDLGTGVDLCLAMNQLFPNTFDVHKIKNGSKLSQSDKRSNFQLLREAFKSSGINKNFPSEIMLQQNFQTNFYFAQWFVRFFEANRKQDDQSSTVKDKDKDTDKDKDKTTMKSRKSIQGGARIMPKESPSRNSQAEDPSSVAITPVITTFTKTGIKRQPISKCMSYGKLNYSIPDEVPCTEKASQTEDKCSFEDNVDNLMDTQRQLQRVSMDKINCIEKLQLENEQLSESLEHCNLQKSYFHKKLDRIEELCEDCSSETLRSSLKRILYGEGLPM